MSILHYEDLYKLESVPILMTIKLKLIQAQIQIVRPTNWCNKRTINLILQQMNTERLNSIEGNMKFQKRWELFTGLKNNELE
jgi:hypothetical protein